MKHISANKKPLTRSAHRRIRSSRDGSCIHDARDDGRRALRRLVASILCCGLAATAAHAHVTLAPDKARADAMIEARFAVPHGCEGAATVALRIRIPEGVTSVKPQMKAGWRVEIKRRNLAQPVKGEHGRTLTDVVEEVSYTGGPLPDELYDDFNLRLRLPDTPGRVLYFPVVQECEKGVSRWIEIPGPGKDHGELRTPAPALILLPKAP